MRPRAAALVVSGFALLALGACASRAGAADPAAIAAQATPAGIAPELVLVTDIDGFELNPQLVGVMGSDGMSAGYLRDASTVMLMTSRAGDPPAAEASVPCAELPDSHETVLRCTVERGGVHVVHTVERGGVHVVLEGQDVEAATLRAAAEAVRVPRADELDHLFSNIPKGHVERGDLPREGDGAPVDPPAAGG